MEGIINMRKMIYVITAFVMFLIGCNDSGTGGDILVPAKLKMQTGSTWGYITTMVNKRYDTLWVFQSEDTIFQNSVVRCEKENDEVLNQSGLVRLRTQTQDGQDLFVQSHWYINNSSNLIRFAYTNNGVTAYVMPKRKEGKYLSVQEYLQIRGAMGDDLILHKPNTDTISAFESPQILLRYPVKAGESWVMFQTPWHSVRKVIGTEMLNNPLGLTEVYKIETKYNLGVTYYDYINLNQGLIKREFHDTLIMTGADDPGKAIGYVIWTERSDLISR